MKTLYSNTKELSDGRILRVDYSICRLPGNYYYPPEDDIGETTFTIDGKSVDRGELPSEVTDEVIEELEYHANSCEDTGADGPDEFFEDDIPDYP